MNKNILYYITGHGYGHAVRSAEVIFALAELSSQTMIHVKTSAPSWLFTYKNNPKIQLHPCNIDVGAVQKNSFQVDIEATFHQVDSLLGSWHKIQKEETEFVRKNNIDLIVGDIPPLAFRIAHQLSIPSYAIGNFGWDWIYSDWLKIYPQFSDIISQIYEDYSTVDLLFQLPASEPMNAFPKKIQSPLIARKGYLNKSDIAKEFNIAEDQKWMLLALPQYDQMHVPWKKMMQNKDWIYLSPFHKSRIKNVIPIPREGFRFSDLVAVSDVVLSKPGYGIVSDCFANRVPLLYIQRDDFVECDVIVQWLNQNSVASELTFDQFKSGDWQESLVQLDDHKYQWSNIRVDGDRFIAEYILKE